MRRAKERMRRAKENTVVRKIKHKAKDGVKTKDLDHRVDTKITVKHMKGASCKCNTLSQAWAGLDTETKGVPHRLALADKLL